MPRTVGVWGSKPGAAAERRVALLALALLIVIALVDALSDEAQLYSPLVLGPLFAGLAARPRHVAAVGAVAFVLGVVMGAVNDMLGSERQLVALLVIALGTLVATIAARRRVALEALRGDESRAYERIALLDRSTMLIRSPMEFDRRLREFVRLPVPDLADLCMIDLATEGGRLEGVIACAAAPEVAATVEEVRRSHPIDPAGEHPVAVALRTGEPQLRGAMSDAELARYASDPQHLEVMRRLQYRSAVVVPVQTRGRTLGVLSVLRLGDPVPFGEADLTLMTDLAGRAAVALDNARLFEERVAAEARLQATLDNLAEAVTIVSADGDLVYINAAAARLFGYGDVGETLRVPVTQMFADFDLFGEDGEPIDPVRLPGRRILAGEEPPPLVVRRRHRATGDEAWLLVKASAVTDPASGRTVAAVNVIEDVTEERRAREAATFMSEASRLLASSLDFEETLDALARAAVPRIADWCGVDLVAEDGRLETVGVAHVDPEKVALARELRARYPPPPDAESGTRKVIRTGEAEFIEEVDPALVEAAAVDADHLRLLRVLDMTSMLVVPMVAGERTIGTITFVTSGGRHLAEGDRELAEELGRRAGVAVDNARLHRARSHVASTLQRSLLPPRLPVVPGIALAARFRAAGEANQVGGDFYDLFQAGESWIVVIGDVTGKGPDAAAITSLARYTMRTAAMYETEPVAMVRRLNTALLADDEHRQMCTLACMRITPAPGTGAGVRAELVCAGHPPPYLVRADGDLEELCRPGPLLGAFADAEWLPAGFRLERGDGVVLYTDGVTDTRGAGGRFGQRRLEEVLAGAAGQGADAIAQRLDDALLDFQRGPQRDDVALLVVQAGELRGAAETSVVAGSAADGA
jgi:GAF domain-containing protein